MSEIATKSKQIELPMNVHKQHSAVGTWLIAIVLAVVVVIALWICVGVAQIQAKEQAASSVRQAVLDSAMQCFAIEGAYPSSITYLEENYGLSLNKDDYQIMYEAFAGNLPPTVKVVAK